MLSGPRHAHAAAHAGLSTALAALHAWLRLIEAMLKLLTCNALPALSPLTAQIDALTDCKCVWSALTMTHTLLQDANFWVVSDCNWPVLRHMLRCFLSAIRCPGHDLA